MDQNPENEGRPEAIALSGREATPDPIADTYGAQPTAPPKEPWQAVPFGFSLTSYGAAGQQIQQNDRVAFVREQRRYTGAVGLIQFGRVTMVAQDNFINHGNGDFSFKDDDIVLVLMVENEPNPAQPFVILFHQIEPQATVDEFQIVLLEKAQDAQRRQEEQQDERHSVNEQKAVYRPPIHQPGLKQIDAVVYPSTERTIYVLHDEKYGGAHRYVVANSLGFDPARNEAVYAHGEHQVLQFVNGVYGTDEQIAGLQSEQIVLILLDRLEKMNAVYPDPSNEKQKAGLLLFLEGCADRVKARMERQVMGQHKS